MTRIALDPFSDNTGSAHVVFMYGFVHVGPNESGASIARFAATGQFSQVLPFSVAKDLSGTNTMSNTQPGPFTRLGNSGCSANTTCGPDNEDHRVFMFGGDLGGNPTLAFGPSRAGGALRYAYTGVPGLTTAPLAWADLAGCIPGGTTAYTAGLSFKGRLYFGLSNNTTQRPGLVMLATRPSMPGLDAVPLLDCHNLEARLMPGLAGAAPNRIDSIGAFNDRLYVANGDAWYRSTTDNPRSYASYPGDWLRVTPSAAAYGARASKTSIKDVSFGPSDLAVPHFAAFGGRFFAGRNTTAGPQLWSCNPALTDSPSDCDAGDWQLLAPNSSGDTLLSQFNTAALASVTMVEATPNFLYVGFNSNGGVRVFRTSSPAATSRADFRGEASCAADLAPTGCQPLGGAGFLDADNTFIYSATPFQRFNGEQGLVLTTGRPSVPTRVFRIDD
ncbi:MAG: hypothetical protein IAE78_17355 [Myxococcus sp.]|nr:hypothetical protein [Myxococcus sp.]